MSSILGILAGLASLLWAIDLVLMIVWIVTG